MTQGKNMSERKRFFKQHAAGSKIPQQILSYAASKTVALLPAWAMMDQFGNCLRLCTICFNVLFLFLKKDAGKCQRINNLDGQVAKIENHKEMIERALSHKETITNTKQVFLKYCATPKKRKNKAKIICSHYQGCTTNYQNGPKRLLFKTHVSQHLATKVISTP